MKSIRVGIVAPHLSLTKVPLMLIRIISISLLLLLTACGEQVSNVPKTNHIHNVVQTSFENNPVILKQQISLCDNKYEQTGIFDLQLFLNGYFTTLRADLIKDSRVISKTLFGEEVEFIVEGRKAEIIKRVKPVPVEICSDENEFERESVESASLNASFYINKTFEAFKKASPDVRVTPVTLNISPSIMRSIIIKNANGTFRKSSMYITDNAYYQPTTASINFLPHSEEMKDGGYKVNFWEIPMVASHEYGHHLFQMIYQHNTHRRAVGCFGYRQQNNFEEKSVRRSTSIDDVINAFNEGFADLVAWYSLNKRERLVTGIKCLEVSRDIGSAFFYDGKPKKFSTEALQAFFSNDLRNIVRPCEYVSYQDIHTMGAVFAYTTNQVLSLLGISEEEKLAVIIEWVKFLKNERKKYQKHDAERFLKNSLSTLVRISIDKHGRGFNQRLCRRINDLFPTLNLSECSLQ